MKKILQRLFLINVIAVLATIGLHAQVTIGATNYSTLKAAFDGINAGNHMGTVNIMINANIVETATAVLNASGVGSAQYNAVNIYTSGNYTVSGRLRALVELRDADNVTIDGRVNQTGEVNALTFQNDSSANSAVIWVDSLITGGDGAKNVRLRYLNIIGGSATTSTTYGVVASASTAFTTGAAGIDNLQITYCKFSRSYYGIRTTGLSAVANYQKGLLVRFNNFGAKATAGMGHYYGAYISYAVSPSIRDNYISINSTTTIYSLYLNYCSYASVSGNTIEYTTTTSTLYGIYPNYCNNTIISNNAIQNNNTTSTIYAIYPYYGSYANVMNNTVQNNTTTGSLYSIYSYYSTFPSVTNNTIQDNSCSLFYGLYVYYNAKFANIMDNTIKNISATSTVYGIYLTNGDSVNIGFNYIDNIKTTTAGSGYGISVSTSTGSKIYNNNVTNIHSYYDMYGGIYAVTLKNSRIANNNIGNLSQSYVSTVYGANGMYLSSCENDTLVNNSVFGVYGSTPGLSSSYGSTGIRILSGTGYAIWHNSVSIAGTPLAPIQTATALMVTSTAVTGLNVKNNVFSTTLATGAGAKSYAIYLAGTGNLTNSVFDYNDYYVSSPNATFGYLGAEAADLTAWRALAVGQDINSKSVAPLFNSRTSLRPADNSPLVGAGGPMLGLVPEDQLGIPRSATTPTIGAYEEAGDFVPPEISYTPLGNSVLSIPVRTLDAQITDLSGVNTTTSAPRLYFKKKSNANTYDDNTNATNGWKYSEATGQAPNFTFTINHALIYGGLAMGDTIQYFVVAQDEYINPMFGVSGATFEAEPASTHLTAADFPVTGLSRFYKIMPSFAGNVDVGAGQTYTSLTDSTGIFRMLNGIVLDGNVVINIVSDIEESGAFGLNGIASAGGNYTITIRPSGAPRTLTFNKTGSALLFNGTDRLMVDGRLGGYQGNALTIENLATGATNLIDIAGTATDGATNVTIRNLNLISGSNASAYGIVIRGTSTTTGVNSHNNISILNNEIKRVYYGIAVYGASPGINDLTIQGNIIGDEDNAKTVQYKGIYIQDCYAPQILYNTIKNIRTTSSLNNAGIDFASGSIKDANIVGNIIAGVYSLSSGGWGAYGINFNTTSAFNTYMANNLISDIYTVNYSSSTTYNAFGIRVTGGIGYKVYNNTINMSGATENIGSGAGMNAAICVTSTAVDSVYFANNIIVNSTTHNNAGAKAYIYYLPAATWTGAKYVDYNHYYNGSNYPMFAYLGADIATFDDWKNAVIFDDNSTYGEVDFMSPQIALISGGSIGDAELIKPLNPLGPIDDIHGELRTADNNYAGGDIAEPLDLYIAQDLPSSVLRGTEPFILEFQPQIAGFVDGIDRELPDGDVASMEYTWFQNNLPLVSGNGIEVDRNVLTFEIPQAAQSGNYYATVSLMGLTAQTGVCALLIDPLMPNLRTPENLSTDQPVTNTLFEWSAPAAATSYQVQVSTSPTFATTLIDTIVTANTANLSGMDYLTTYYWRVRGQNATGSSNWSEVYSFITRPAIYPSTLIAPEDNATFVEVQDEFSWEGDNAATAYRIQISTDIAFTNPYINAVTADTYYVPTTPLDFTTQYFWRVQGFNANYESEWSEIYSLTTRPAIYKPVLVSPKNNAIRVAANLDLTWNYANGATSYRVQVSADPTFATTTANQVVTDTLFNISNLLGETQFYWRVQGLNPTHSSEWSDTWKFTTKKLFWILANDTVTIGDPTSTSTTAMPFYTLYEDSRSQILWTKAEIDAVGGLAGSITGLAFNVSTVGSPDMDGFTIRAANTSLTSLSGFVTSGLTTVYSKASEGVAATGWKYINFQTPFAWDETSNVLFDICWDNDNWSGSSYVQATTTTANTVYQRYHDNAAPGCSTGNTDGYLGSQILRPNVKLMAYRNEQEKAQLVYPEDESDDIPLEVNFTWEPMGDASSYKIQVATDEAFTNIVASQVVTVPTALISGLEYVSTYYWRVQGANLHTESLWSDAWSFTTRPAIHPVVLIAPAKNAQFLSPNQLFQWHTDPDAIAYQFQVSTSPTFATFITDLTISDTSNALLIPANSTIYWRVRGLSMDYDGEWSEVWSFTTVPNIYPPTLIYPVNGNDNAFVNAKLTWSSISNAIGYTVEIATNSNFTNLVATNTSADTTLMLWALDDATTFYWRARSFNTVDTSSWTATWSFTTMNQTPEVEIGDPNSTLSQPYAPIHRYYNYSASETIYTVGEVGSGQKIITSIAYNKVSGADVSPITAVSIYMKHTTDSTIVAGYNLSTYQLVYNGTFPNGAVSGWMGVDLDSTFSYNGVDNLQILILHGNQAYTSSYPYYQYTARPTNRTAYSYSDGSLPTATSTLVKNIPNIRLTFLATSLIAEVPELVSPANGAINRPRTQNLVWNPVTVATNYKVQVSTDPTFATTYLSDIVPTTNYVLTNLDTSKTYYWRVKALNDSLTSLWSEAWSFTTWPYMTAPGVLWPDLVSPANGTTNAYQNIELVWQSSVNATDYTVEVSTTPAFTNLVATTTTQSTSFDLWALDGGVKYYWRVKAFNATETSLWSEVWSFTTVSLKNEVVVGDTTSTGNGYYSPINRLYNYTVSSTIYTAEELGLGAKPIKGVYYNKMSGPASNIDNVAFYMRHNADSTNVAGPYDVTNYSLVWEGDDFPNGATSGWMGVELDSVFSYNGADNLEILVVKDYQAWGNTAYYQYTAKPTSRVAYAQSDASLPTATTTLTANTPVTRFEFIVSTIGSPELMNPPNNAMNRALTQNLVWDAVQGATYYKIQASADPTFNTKIVDNIQTGTNYILFNLEEKTKYYWRVKALDDTSASSWSPVWNFTTIFPDVASTTLISPANNTINTPLSPVLEWTPAANATDYQLMVGLSATFDSVVFNGYLGETIKNNLLLTWGTQYYWKVRAMNPSDTSDWTPVWTFTTIPELLPPTMVSPADSATDVSIFATLTWLPYPTVTKYVVQVSDDALSFASPVFVDTVTTTSTTTTMLDGNTEYFWRVRSFRDGSWSPWSDIRMFETGTGAVAQDFSLVSGWNMISAYVASSDNIGNILAPLAGNLQQAKDAYGQIYAPPFTSTLTNWNKYHAYQLRLTTSAQFQMMGLQIEPDETPITLDALGWYWLPYYRTSAMPTATALASISGKYLQVKSITGEVYQPPFATTLANLDPGKGYMIRLTATDGVLTYPANTIIKQSTNNTVIAEPKVFVRENNVTGKTAFIALDINANNGDEIGVFTRDGMLVGSSVWQDALRGVVVWGDDEFTQAKDGASEGEELIVKVWSKANKSIGSVEQTVLNDMTTNVKQYTLRYETDAVYFLKGNVEADNYGLTITPQPASTEVFIYLNAASEDGVEITLYNQAGQLMLTANESAANGVIKLNTSNLPSGVYQAMVNIDGKVTTERIVIVK